MDNNYLEEQPLFEMDILNLDEIGTFENNIFNMAYNDIKSKRNNIIQDIFAGCPAVAALVDGLRIEETVKIVLTDDVKKKIATGVYKMMNSKNGEGFVKAVVVDAVTKKTVNVPDVIINNSLKGINPVQMATAMQGMAIEMKLKEISEQLDEISTSIHEVLRGQHNDRLAKYYTGVSLYKEALAVRDDNLHKQLTNLAILQLTEAYSELSLNLKSYIEDINSNYDLEKNKIDMKPKIIKEKMGFINSSFQAIHKTIALKTAIYYKEGEYTAAVSALSDYGKYLKTVLSPKACTALYQVDTAQNANSGIWMKRSQELPIKIDEVRNKLVDKGNYYLEISKEDLLWPSVKNAVKNY